MRKQNARTSNVNLKTAWAAPLLSSTDATTAVPRTRDPATTGRMNRTCTAGGE